MSRPTRDEYGLALAGAAALMADCTRRKVGAAIVHPTTHQVISLGYNGLAAGKPGCLTAGACPRGALSYLEQTEFKDYEATGCRAVHAEVNAIIRAGRDRCIGATIYVTAQPCFHCSVVIEGAGLARVVVPPRICGGIVPGADVHEHRAVAEQVLGRKLHPGEVVHHEDLNKQNNDPVNLIVFVSQAQHARHHKLGHPGRDKCDCYGIRLKEVTT